MQLYLTLIVTHVLLNTRLDSFHCAACLAYFKVSFCPEEDMEQTVLDGYNRLVLDSHFAFLAVSMAVT